MFSDLHAPHLDVRKLADDDFNAQSFKSLTPRLRSLFREPTSPSGRAIDIQESEHPHPLSRAQQTLALKLPGNRFPKHSICHDDSDLWKADVGDSGSPEHLQVETSSLLPGIMDVLALFHLMLTHYPARSF